MKVFREEDFPLFQALKEAKASTAGKLMRLFEASAGLKDKGLLTFSQQLYLTAHFLPQDMPGIPRDLVKNNKKQLLPIFKHYARKGDRWSSQVVRFHYSKVGDKPDPRQEKIWAKINARNNRLSTPENMWLAIANENFSRAQKMYTAGVKPPPWLLTNLVANACLKSALWVLKQPGHLGLDINALDEYPVAANEEYLARLPFRTQDTFGWQRGDYLRNTALILALKKGWDRGESGNSAKPFMKDVARLLLAQGADPNLQDGCGNTALHIAVLHRNTRAIKALLENGARQDIANNGGLRPVDLLKVDYARLDPFFYRQTGHDTNCYIHTLLPEPAWREAGKDVKRLLKTTNKSRRPSP